MTKTVAVVGIRPEELDYVRSLLDLLRHEDIIVAELARQALQYLQDAAKDRCTAIRAV